MQRLAMPSMHGSGASGGMLEDIGGQGAAFTSGLGAALEQSAGRMRACMWQSHRALSRRVPIVMLAHAPCVAHTWRTHLSWACAARVGPARLATAMNATAPSALAPVASHPGSGPASCDLRSAAPPAEEEACRPLACGCSWGLSAPPPAAAAAGRSCLRPSAPLGRWHARGREQHDLGRRPLQ